MDAAHILLRFQINGLLIVKKNDSNNVIGILTTTDLLGLLNKALSRHVHKTLPSKELGGSISVDKTPPLKELGGSIPLDKMRELDKIAKLPVVDVASRNVLKIQKNTKLKKVIAIMHRRNMHTIPVYGGTKLLGVIGRHDILNAAFYSSSRE